MLALQIPRELAHSVQPEMFGRGDSDSICPYYVERLGDVMFVTEHGDASITNCDRLAHFSVMSWNAHSDDLEAVSRSTLEVLS